MPITSTQRRKFKPSRKLKKTYDSFREGLNTLLRESELDDDQAPELTNLLVEGKGILTQKPGSKEYFTAHTNGKLRGLFGADIDTNELLAITDDGYLSKKNGTTYTQINGSSWASGARVYMEQLQRNVYITQKGSPLTRYDGTTLLSYVTISAPTNLTATNLSGVTGTYTWAWRVSAFTDVGRTLPSEPITLENLPEDLIDSPVQITWSAPSAASGLIKGFEIYGREQGAQTRMTGVQPTTTSWIDDGTLLPSQIAFMPDFNETGGPSAKYNIKSAGKIVLANIAGHKSRVMWSGADVNVGRFHWTKGGGYIDISPDDGQEITGVKEVAENKIIVWKNRSIYQMTLTFNSDLGIVEPSVQKISDAVGCLSHDTIQTAENDTLFVGERPGGGIALNSLGYEANILANILRTAEVSAAIRPTLQAINRTRREDMFSLFFNQRYWWFFPIGSNTMRAVVYDYQRRSFTGPMTIPNNPSVGTVYFDENEAPHMLLGSGSDATVIEISETFSNDGGSDFTWNFASKKEDFKLPFQLKTLLRAFIHLADVSGSGVNVEVLTEDPEGNATVEKSFSIDSPNTLAGFGSFPFGYQVRWGSSQQASTSNSNTSDVRRYIDINKNGVITAQVKISGTGTQAKVVAVELIAREETSPPSQWQVT